METRTYDPMLVDIMWGNTILTGLADDSIVEAVRNSESVTFKVGVKGDVAYAESADKTGNVKVSLMHTSASLPSLRKDAQNKIKRSLTIQDANRDGKIMMTCADCRIKKLPDVKYGKETGMIDVEFIVPVLEYK